MLYWIMMFCIRVWDRRTHKALKQGFNRNLTSGPLKQILLLYNGFFSHQLFSAIGNQFPNVSTYFNYRIIQYAKQNKKGDQKENGDEGLPEIPKKRIGQLPGHAQHILKRAHAGAIKEYQDPEKRGWERDDEGDEEVSHKVAWSAVKGSTKRRGKTV
jgi:cation transport regulator